MICEFVPNHMSRELVCKYLNPDFILKDERCEIVPKDVIYEYVFEMRLVTLFLKVQAVRAPESNRE